MCYIDAHEKQHPSSYNGGSSGGGNALPSNLTTEVLVSLGANVDFIYSWIKCFDYNDLAFSNIYTETMQDFLKKIPIQLPKSFSLHEKCQ